jgi:hypothetical protein
MAQEKEKEKIRHPEKKKNMSQNGPYSSLALFTIPIKVEK